jgi:hypothetical protein
MRTRVAHGVVRGWQPLVGSAHVLEGRRTTASTLTAV